jgi:hypothetical protein
VRHPPVHQELAESVRGELWAPVRADFLSNSIGGEDGATSRDELLTGGLVGVVVDGDPATEAVDACEVGVVANIEEVQAYLLVLGVERVRV